MSTKTAQQLREQAVQIRKQVKLNHGPAYHRAMQAADHLVIEANTLDAAENAPKHSVVSPAKPSGQRRADNPPQRKKDLAAIHAIKNKLGLDEDTYRDMLEQLTGQRSAAKLTGVQRFKVIQHLQASLPKKAQHYPGRPHNTDSTAQLKKIEALLAEAGYPWAYAAAIALRQCDEEKLEFCSSAELSAVITALMTDAKRHGRRVR